MKTASISETTSEQLVQVAESSPFFFWSDEDTEQLLWDAGVFTLIITQGFRKAATDEFLNKGYRLATISRDLEPFDYIHKLSLYTIGDQARLGRSEAKKLAHAVMKKIGLRLKADECHVEVVGRRLVVSVALPHWAWPQIKMRSAVPYDDGLEL